MVLLLGRRRYAGDQLAEHHRRRARRCRGAVGGGRRNRREVHRYGRRRDRRVDGRNRWVLLLLGIADADDWKDGGVRRRVGAQRGGLGVLVLVLLYRGLTWRM